jgi:hypothetical protein
MGLEVYLKFIIFEDDRVCSVEPSIVFKMFSILADRTAAMFTH